MKSTTFIAALAASASVLIPAAAMAGSLQGDYVEARTASVFAGPCHYGGEYMSDGREAVLAWHVTHGSVNGVSLDGLSAVAVVRSGSNLGDADARKTTALYIDSSATAGQRLALADALKAACGDRLGAVQSVDAAKIRFSHGSEIVVNAPGVASLDIAPLPNRECCKQPSLVWYKPVAPIDGRLVGFTKRATCAADASGDAWTRGDENSAFYGTFRY